LFAREILVPKGLDTTTIMELTKWSLILVVVMVLFLSNGAKFGHHHQVPHCHQTKKHTENLVAKSMHAQPHTHTVIDNSDLRTRLQVLCATIYVCAQEKEFAENKHSRILLVVCCTSAHTHLQERIHSTFAKNVASFLPEL
jgi:hypothetical protein